MKIKKFIMAIITLVLLLHCGSTTIIANDSISTITEENANIAFTLEDESGELYIIEYDDIEYIQTENKIMLVFTDNKSRVNITGFGIGYEFTGSNSCRFTFDNATPYTFRGLKFDVHFMIANKDPKSRIFDLVDVLAPYQKITRLIDTNDSSDYVTNVIGIAMATVNHPQTSYYTSGVFSIIR